MEPAMEAAGTGTFAGRQGSPADACCNAQGHRAPRQVRRRQEPCCWRARWPVVSEPVPLKPPSLRRAGGPLLRSTARRRRRDHRWVGIMPSRDRQLDRLRRLRFELGRELGQLEEARRRTAAEENGRNADQLVVSQQQDEALPQEPDRLLAMSMRPWW